MEIPGILESLKETVSISPDNKATVTLRKALPAAIKRIFWIKSMTANT